MKKSNILRLILVLFVVFGIAFGTFSAVLSFYPAKEAIVVTPQRHPGTLIIDPGHGGADGGAVSVTGKYESAINLEISQKIAAISGLFGVNTIVTRDSEDIPYPESAGTIHAKKVWDTKRRVELANSTSGAFFLSIHQNIYTNSRPTGCQVFFAPTQGSREMAEHLQKLLLTVAPGNRQTAVRIGEGVYIMNNITCPGVLVECGFLSNPAEAKKLEDPAYQLKLACVILGGVISEQGNQLT